MKFLGVLLLVCIAVGTHGREGRGAKRRENRDKRIKEMLKKPICKCDVIEKCIGDGKEQVTSCAERQECVDELGESNVDPTAIKECFEATKQPKAAFKECIATELGKKCDDGSGSISEPDDLAEQISKGRGGRKRGGGRKGAAAKRLSRRGKDRTGRRAMRSLKKQLRRNKPRELRKYRKCVRKCIKGDKKKDSRAEAGSAKKGRNKGRGKGGRRSKGRRGGKGKGKGKRKRKGKGKGRGLKKRCMKENDCRGVFHLPEDRKAAREACAEKRNVDLVAQAKQLCTCLKSAGLVDLNCTMPETGSTRLKRETDFIIDSFDVDVTAIDGEGDDTDDDDDSFDGIGITNWINDDEDDDWGEGITFQ